MLERTLRNPLGKAREQEIVADEPGRYRKGGALAVLSALEPSTPAHETIVRRFATELASELRAGLESKEIEAAVVIAPPRLLGRVQALIPDKTKPRITVWIAKDLSRLDLRTLRERLPDLLMTQTRA